MDKLYPITYAFGSIDKIKQTALFYDCVIPFPFEVFPKYNGRHAVTSQQVVENIFEVIPVRTYNHLLHPISTIMGDPHKFGREGLEISAMFKIYLLVLQNFSNEIYKGKEFTYNVIPPNNEATG